MYRCTTRGGWVREPMLQYLWGPRGGTTGSMGRYNRTSGGLEQSKQPGFPTGVEMARLGLGLPPGLRDTSLNLLLL